MKNIIYTLIVALLFVACAQKNPDNLFTDEVYNEKVYLASRNYQELIKIYKARLSKQDDFKTRLQLSQYYYDSKDYNSVLYYLEPLVRTKQSVQALILQSKALEGAQRFDEALDILYQAIQIDPKLPEIYNLQGIAYAAKKDYPKAKESFLQAKKFFLSDEIINANLGMIAILQGQYKEALGYLMPLYKIGHKDLKILNNLVFALVKDNQALLALEIVEKEKISKSPRRFIRNLQKIKVNFDGKKQKG